MRSRLQEREGVDPNDVILSPEVAKRRGMTSTVCFPHGNLAPHGSVIKSTAIDPSVVGTDGVYQMTGPAKVFTSEASAIQAIKAGKISAGDIIVLEPGEATDFRALEKTTTVVVKMPSVLGDKYPVTAGGAQ